MAVIVWLAVMFENVYEVTAPTEMPSTITFATRWPLAGVIVRPAGPSIDRHCITRTDGAFGPELTVMVKVSMAKFAAMVWLGRHIREGVGCHCAHGGSVHQYVRNVVAYLRRDREGLACPVVYRLRGRADGAIGARRRRHGEGVDGKARGYGVVGRHTEKV